MVPFEKKSAFFCIQNPIPIVTISDSLFQALPTLEKEPYIIFGVITNTDRQTRPKPNLLMEATKSKLGFYVPFNSQGHIGTGPQHLPLVGVEPTHRGDSLWLDAKLANPLCHRGPIWWRLQGSPVFNSLAGPRCVTGFMKFLQPALVTNVTEEVTKAGIFLDTLSRLPVSYGGPMSPSDGWLKA